MTTERVKLSTLDTNCDDPKRLGHTVAYCGPGWYSLADDDVFYQGAFSTYCRIYIRGRRGNMLQYSPKLPIRNLEQLPQGRGARYLEVMPGDCGDLVAVRWRRKAVCGPNHQLVQMPANPSGATDVV